MSRRVGQLHPGVAIASSILGCLVAFVPLASVAGPLAPDSPLAANSTHLFGVANDGRSLMIRSRDAAGTWAPLTVSSEFELGRIGGITATADALFVSDPEHSAVLRISLTGQPTRYALRGRPLERPAQLAVTRDTLFISDEAQHALLIAPLSASEPRVERIKIDARDGLFLAASRNRVFASEANAQSLSRLDFEKKGWVVRPIEADDSPERITFSTSSQTRRPDPSTPPSQVPRIEQIGKIAARDDIAYFVDPIQHVIYSTPTDLLRPVWSQLSPGGVPVPGSLIATEDDLWILDSERGDVTRIPRPVPVEFAFEGPLQSECAARLYDYLQVRGMLPVASTPLVESVEKTMRAAGALRAPYVAALDGVLCGLNPELCQRGRFRSPLPGNVSITIPKLRIESRLAFRRVKLDGKRSLGQMVETGVFSPAFSYAKSMEHLCKMNASLLGEEKCSDALLKHREGEFLLPVEVVLFIAAVPHADVADGTPKGGLAEFQKACPFTSINSLERREAIRSQADAAETARTSADAAYATMLASISFAADKVRSIQNPAYIGVAEDGIDTGFADFRGADNKTAFGESNPAPEPLPTSIEIREEFEKDDHGTAVTYLIGGRRNRLSETRPAGLAPFSIVVPLTQQHLNNISDLFLLKEHFSETFVVNLSLRIDSPDPGLTRLIKDNGQTLFVAAAGNTDRTGQEEAICEANLAYPACYSEFPNVLVVGATTKDGKALLPAGPDSEGSNWNPNRVQIGAPGEGFYSAGRRSTDGSKGFYVPVRGTSFAAPLVSATAAALVAQGISDSKQVKTRIISTADYESGLVKHFLAGRLNYRRAITDPKRALLVDANGEHFVEIKNDPGELKLHGYNAKRVQQFPTVNFQNIFRIEKIDHNLRILYEENGEIRRLHSARITGPQSVPLTLVEHLADGSTRAINDTSLDDYSDYIAPVR